MFDQGSRLVFFFYLHCSMVLWYVGPLRSGTQTPAEGYCVEALAL